MSILSFGIILLAIFYCGVSVFYLGCGILYAMKNAWVTSKFADFFPVLASKKWKKSYELADMGFVVLMTAVIGTGLWLVNPIAMIAAIVLSALEVYLGATFYFDRITPSSTFSDRLYGPDVHMALHSFIIGGLLGYIDLVLKWRFWEWQLW
jgi:hypothetical protein